MSIHRRYFIQLAGATTLGFTGLQHLFNNSYASKGQPTLFKYGDRITDPNGILDLPSGFSYKIISQTGDVMNDGLLVPSKHDGMAAFPGPDGKTILVRNHENTVGSSSSGPFGDSNELFNQVDSAKVFDTGFGSSPRWGGTTTLLYDTRTQTLEGHELSLAGTVRNCAGGPTPWNSWVTCEETVQNQNAQHSENHGYNFEVPANYGSGLADPNPIREMGRFNHEAIAVDPQSGALYQTEDRDDGLLYRNMQTQSNSLQNLGPLHALKVVGQNSFDTRNWSGTNVTVGQKLDVEWIALTDIEPDDDSLRDRGFAQGAARFARGEGAWYGNDAIYFTMTSGGSNRIGQVWKYVPSPFEGTAQEDSQPATIELFLEPNNQQLLERPDNLTVAPWGDLIICEDGSSEQFIVGVTTTGEIFPFAKNALNNSEFAGACFSPDGSTLFVNIQTPGFTLAITGPWISNEPTANSSNWLLY